MTCFDEEPDGNIHGECAAEIHRLQSQIAKLEERIRVADAEEPVAWMFPDDLEKFKSSETFAQAYSIKVGSPDGLTEPLYLHAQIPGEVELNAEYKPNYNRSNCDYD